LQKIRTLAVQAANGTNTGEDKAALSKEATALVAEIDRIAGQTRFGGALILDGSKDTGLLQGNLASVGQLTLQVGANKGDAISFDIANAHFTRIADASKKFGGAGGGAGGNTIDITKFYDKTNKVIQFSKAGGAEVAIQAMDALIGQIDSERAGLGAIQNRLESSIRNQANVSANQADARSRIRDADFAEESANLSQQSIIQQAASSMLMQANTRPQLGLSLLG
ncbi:flagellin, partial [Anaerobiospirillum sp. NML120449]|uniref:flagellin n=1 Tax=Anaerobiospirillum sp. NML120449 TaxID=2932817 RepID=UPI001FF2AB7B